MELRSKGVNQSSVSEEEPLDQQTTETDLRKKDTVALAVQIRPRTKANETAGSGGYKQQRPPPNCERTKELQLLDENRKTEKESRSDKNRKTAKN
jgi:hypothetical protein